MTTETNPMVPVIEVRHVLYNVNRGIYLGFLDGKRRWSLEKERGFEVPGAMTFLNKQEVDDHFARTVRGSVPKWNEKYTRLVEVRPSLPNNMASPEDCANAALPIWNNECCPG